MATAICYGCEKRRSIFRDNMCRGCHQRSLQSGRVRTCLTLLAQVSTLTALEREKLASLLCKNKKLLSDLSCVVELAEEKGC